MGGNRLLEVELIIMVLKLKLDLLTLEPIKS